MPITVTPVAPFGAEIGGVDLAAPLPEQDAAALRGLLAEHQVLVFRDQDIDTAQQVAFAESLGPTLRFASVVDPDAGPSKSHEVRGSTTGWHIDASPFYEPPVATMLRAVVVPPEGGDTLFASGSLAFDELPDDLRTAIEGRHATHGGATPDRPLVAHSLRKTHPVSGRPVLYINLADWADAVVVGLGREESDALVDRLRAIYLDPSRVARVQWRPGTVTLWDNRSVQHSGTADYGDQDRLMVRVCIAGLHG